MGSKYNADVYELITSVEKDIEYVRDCIKSTLLDVVNLSNIINQDSYETDKATQLMLNIVNGLKNAMSKLE